MWLSLQLSFTLCIAQYPEDMSGNCCYRNTRSTVVLLNVVMEQRQPNSDCQVSTENVRFPSARSGGRWEGEKGGKAT